MTLIAIHTHDNTAEIISDTIEYTPNGRHVHDTGRNKSWVLSNGIAVTAGSGNTHLADRWFHTAEDHAANTDDFEEFAATTGPLIKETWERVTRISKGRIDDPPNVYHVGWSPNTGTFKAYAYAPSNDYNPVDVTGLHTFPSPWSHRPSAIERAYVAERFLHFDFDPVQVADAMEVWTQRPPLDPPETIHGWADIADQIRRERALEQSGGVIIGGKLHHLTINRHGVGARQTIHLFNDTPAETAYLVSGTLHPLCQASPCGCGSGRRWIDCHLADELDDPCTCGSDVPLARCCAITNPEPMCPYDDGDCCTRWLPDPEAEKVRHPAGSLLEG